MRATLSLACFTAAVSAFEITNDMPSYGMMAAQVSAQHTDSCCCHMMPCMPTCSAPCEEDSHPVELDVVGDVVDEVKPIGEELVEQAGLEGILADVVGEEEAEAIVEEIVLPVVDTAIIENELPIDDIIEAVQDVEPEVDIVVEQELPEVEDVVEVIENEVLPNHPEVTVVEPEDQTPLTEEQKDNAIVVEVENDEGEEVDIIIIEKPEVVIDVVEDEVIETEPATIVQDEEPPVVEPPVVEPPVVEPPVVEPPVVEETVEEEQEPVVEEVEPVVEEETKPGVYETTVEEIPEGEDALAQILAEADGRPLVLDFQYDACNPCQKLAPDFEALMAQYPDVIFYNVDVMLPQHMALIQELGVRGTPTFKLWVNGELADNDTVVSTTIEPVRDAVAQALEQYEAALPTEEGVDLSQTGSNKQSVADKLSALF